MEDEGKRQSRRDFLSKLFLGTGLIVSFGVLVRNVIRFIFPKVKFKEYKKVLVVHAADIPLKEAKELIVSGEPIFIVHQIEGFKVFSAVCTHLGCLVRWESDKNRFYCPCHKGIFDSNGQVISGPPPRPLDQFKVEQDKNLVYMWIEKRVPG